MKGDYSKEWGVLASVSGSSDIGIREVGETDDSLILQGYALLQQAIGAESVEDLESFRRTVSSATDVAAIPKMVCATSAEDLVGFIVGTYLSNLGMGFIAYSAVSERWRGRGVYTEMRHRIVDLFNQESSRLRSEDRLGGPPMGTKDTTGAAPAEGVLYVISELDEDGPLFSAYLNKWGGIVAPCAYEQPEAQGLQNKDLKLVLQPVAMRTAPSYDETLAIVREVYERIYGIHDVTANASFRRIMACLRHKPLSVG